MLRNLPPGQLKDTFLFFTRLMILAAPLYLVLVFVDLLPLQLLVAQHSFAIMQGLGWTPVMEGAQMAVGEFQFFVSRDSTGWKSMMFLGALIFAVPGILWKKRFIGLLGIGIVYVGNLTRVVGIVAVEQAYGLEAALFTHDVLWQFGLTGLVLTVWLTWWWWVRRDA